MTSYYEPRRLCDVVVEYKGHSFHAHRLMLYVHSEYFQAVIDEPVIRVPDMDAEPDDMKAALDCVYFPRGMSHIPYTLHNGDVDVDWADNAFNLESRPNGKEIETGIKHGLLEMLSYLGMESALRQCENSMRSAATRSDSTNESLADLWKATSRKRFPSIRRAMFNVFYDKDIESCVRGMFINVPRYDRYKTDMSDIKRTIADDLLGQIVSYPFPTLCLFRSQLVARHPDLVVRQ